MRKALLVCSGIKPVAARWQAQTNPLSYSGHIKLGIKLNVFPHISDLVKRRPFSNRDLKLQFYEIVTQFFNRPCLVSFFFIFVFSTQLVVNKIDWIPRADLWCRKRPLYQLSINHWPNYNIVAYHNCILSKVINRVLD